MVEGEIVGFAMYGLFPSEERGDQVWLDRFLIDERFQKRGYGSASLRALIDHIAREYACDEMYLSIFEDNRFAIELYERFGFRFNGELDTKGEKVMVMRLR